ncbi:MAG: hypothetical protein ABIO98_17190 [Chitinophagales bacterium]
MSLLMTGCNKCKTDPILIYASKDILDVGIFQPGSFWVYENDATGVRDSVIVTAVEYKTDTVREACGDGQTDVNYTESFYMFTTSFFYGTNYVSQVKAGEPLLVAKENYPADTLFSNAACTNPGYCNIIETMKVFQKNYSNVYERIDSSSDLYEGRLVHFFSAPNHGLIRREIFLSDSTWETWTLIHHHIVQ